MVDDRFDLKGFRQALKKQGARVSGKIDVMDTYFYSKTFQTYVFRHRIDKEIQHLTMKGLGGGSDARLEVNLHLDQGKGDQRAVVTAFLNQLANFQSLQIKKVVEPFYFPDCEVVYYTARCGGKSLRCVEFEAIQKTTLKRARDVIRTYAETFGFDPMRREHRSCSSF